MLNLRYGNEAAVPCNGSGYIHGNRDYMKMMPLQLSRATHLEVIPQGLFAQLIDLLIRSVQLQKRVVDVFSKIHSSWFRSLICLESLGEVSFGLCDDSFPFFLRVFDSRFVPVSGEFSFDI